MKIRSVSSTKLFLNCVVNIAMSISRSSSLVWP